jgi:4-hydroxy-4-methyl-2-oxoglutarate aldolase
MTSGDRQTLAKGVLDGFRQIDCACIADVLVSLGLNCVVSGIHPLSPGMKVCGPAFTVRNIAARDRRSWTTDEVDPLGLVKRAKPGDVIVIDAGGRLDVSFWGSNAAMAASNKGLSGTVIDGASRDSEEIIRVGYSLFARGVSLPNAHSLVYSTCVNSEPVQIGSVPVAVMVAPGDIVCGEKDGLVVVPRERAAEILELATQRHTSDLKLAEILGQGAQGDDPRIVDLVHTARRQEGLS